MRSVRTVILGLALACISGPGWGQAGKGADSGAAPKAFGLELVGVEHAGEDVEHFIVSEDENGNVKGMAVVKKDCIEFVDKNGKVKKRWARKSGGPKNERTVVIPDEHGKVMALHTRRGERHALWLEGSYLVVDAEGNERMHLEKLEGQCYPRPSPGGDYAVGTFVEVCHAPFFINSTGVFKRWKFGPRYPEAEEWPTAYGAERVAFSPDGTHVGLLASRCGSPGYGFVMLLNAAGETLWRTDGEFIDVAVARGGQLVAASSWTELVCFDARGKTLWIKEFPFRAAGFSNDGEHVLAYGGWMLWMIRVSDGHVEWKWEAPENEFGKHGASLIDQEGFQAVRVAATRTMSRIAVLAATRLRVQEEHGGGFRCISTREYVLMFDSSGHLLGSRSFRGDTFRLGSRIVMMPDGESFSVLANRGIHRFRLKGQLGGD